MLGLSPKLPPATGRTHDFSMGNSWGWAFYVDKPHSSSTARFTGHGFGPRIEVGDWVDVRNVSRSTSRLRITAIEHTRDPDDMFFFEAVLDMSSEGRH